MVLFWSLGPWQGGGGVCSKTENSFLTRFFADISASEKKCAFLKQGGEGVQKSTVFSDELISAKTGVKNEFSAVSQTPVSYGGKLGKKSLAFFEQGGEGVQKSTVFFQMS